MNRIFKCAIDSLSDFFFPSHCMNCGRAIKDGKVICGDCENDIEKIEVKTCLKCGLPVRKCDCKTYVYHFSGISAPFYNEGIAKKGLYRIKFSDNKQLVPYYAQAMAETFYKNFSGIDFDYITYVPMTFLKGLKRGYNQASLLAEELSVKLDIPLIENVLVRKIFSQTQHKRKNVYERFKNAYKSYAKTGKINGGRILLIDDIKTTGASLDACAKELLYAGADEVYCLTALLSNKNS